MALHSIALFAGCGGFELATQHLLDLETVCYVEREPAAVAMLRARIADGVLHDAPIWDDVRTLPAHRFRGVDVVCGGFPCPPFSVAGKGLAGGDPRNCWPPTMDIIRAIRPRYAFLENVPGLLAGSHGYFGTILGELAEAGFDAEWGVLSAEALGGPHRRERLWILATDASGCRIEQDHGPGKPGLARQARAKWPSTDADRFDLRQQSGRSESRTPALLAGDDDGEGAATNAESERRGPGRVSIGEATSQSNVGGSADTDLHRVGCSIERVARVLDGEWSAFRNDADQRADPNPWRKGTAPQPTIPRVDDGNAYRLDQHLPDEEGELQ